MQAVEYTLGKFIEGKKQYIVPRYQRHYSWEKQQWEQLWQDVENLLQKDEEYKHFLGQWLLKKTTIVIHKK